MQDLEATAFRRSAARLNYLARDRPESAFSANTLARHMAHPKVGDVVRMKVRAPANVVTFWNYISDARAGRWKNALSPLTSPSLKKYHLCWSSPINSLWEALNVKARSPDKFMDVSDTQVSDEDGYMTRNLTITANSKIVDVRIWINSVISKIVFQPLHSDTDMSKIPINGVETIVRDGRGFNMTLDAHSFELVYQKTSLSTDDFYNHPGKITDVYQAKMVEMFTSSITRYALLKTILTATDLTHR